MRILYVITSTTLGGAEKTLFSLLSGLDRSKYTPVEVISLKPFGPVADRIAALDIPVSSPLMGYIPSFRSASYLSERIKETKPDIVHAFLFRAIQFARMAKTGSGFRLVSSPRVNYRTRNGIIRFIDRLGKEKDDLVICESDASRKFMLEKQGYGPDRVETIYNGIDTSEWSLSPEGREKIRFAADVREENIMLFASGRLDRQKGYDVLLAAMETVHAANPFIKLLIAGRGPLERPLLDAIEKRGLRECIRLVGEQTNVRDWLSAADIYVLPSLWEGLPNSLLEAMAVGLPCVASGVDGVPEVIQNAETGRLVPPGNPTKLAEAILELAAPDAAGLRKRLARAARERVIAGFGVPEMTALYQRSYDKMYCGLGK